MMNNRADSMGRQKNPYFDPSKRHHRPDGFQNNYIEFSAKSLGDAMPVESNKRKDRETVHSVY